MLYYPSRGGARWRTFFALAVLSFSSYERERRREATPGPRLKSTKKTQNEETASSSRRMCERRASDETREIFCLLKPMGGRGQEKKSSWKAGTSVFTVSQLRPPRKRQVLSPESNLLTCFSCVCIYKYKDRCFTPDIYRPAQLYAEELRSCGSWKSD